MSVDVSGTPSVDLVGELDQQVRSVVRREGVDPQLDITRVRRIAEEVVRAHDERSLTGVVTPVPDPLGVIGELVARVSGLRPAAAVPRRPRGRGDLDQRPEPGLRRAQRSPRADQRHPQQGRGAGAGRADAQVQRPAHRPVPAVRRRDAAAGTPAARRAGGHQPRVRGGEHPQVRAQGGAARTTWCGSARCRPGRRGSSRRPCWRGRTSSSPEELRLARRPCSTAWPQRSPVATGSSRPRRSSSSGSTTPTGWRCRRGRPGWRGPARCRCATWSARRCGCDRPGSSSARSGRPSASTCCWPSTQGLPGLATLHANSAREALVKLCTLPLLAGENISARFVVPTVASSVDLVVHLGIDNGGVRRVNEIVAVPGTGRERHRRDRAGVPAQGRRPRATPAGCPRGSSRSSGPGSTSTGSSTRRADGRCSRVALRRRADPDLVVLPGPDAGATGSQRDLAHPPAAGDGRSRRGQRRRLPRRVRGLRVHRDRGRARRLADGPGRAGVRRDGWLPAGGRAQGPGEAAATRVRRGLARGRRQPRQRRPRGHVAARGALRAVRARTRTAARVVRRLRARLPGQRPVRRRARPAQGAAGRPGGRPGRGEPAGGARGRRW